MLIQLGFSVRFCGIAFCLKSSVNRVLGQLIEIQSHIYYRLMYQNGQNLHWVTCKPHFYSYPPSFCGFTCTSPICSIVDPFPQHYVVFMVQAEDAAIFPPIFWYYVQSMSHFLEVFFMALHKLLNKFFSRLQNQPLKSFFSKVLW